MMELTGLSKEGKGGGEKGGWKFFEDWQTGELTDYSKDSWQISPQAFFEANWTRHFGSRQIGPRQIGPRQTWPLKFFFSRIGPQKSFWRQIGPRKILTLIRRLNNCGECDLAYVWWVGYIQNWSPKTLILQFRGLKISCIYFCHFLSMRPYRALKALNSQFHLNIWTHLEHIWECLQNICKNCLILPTGQWYAPSAVIDVAKM